ncbi:MAG: UDP-2,3-diacylglucosamine diphosphatase, partial [Candidatus Marinimicrobia bacterium]|nr:UDP-2,3-diacylglucosamine diphosphatase [Candidatus Neomarinimicrobiota bacterium]
THGDGILSWDQGYRLLKMVIRNPVFIWLYRWVHPTIGYSIANWISKKGQHYEHSDEYNERILSELEAFSKPYITNGFDYVITGHYHQATEKMINGGKLLILGDWIHYFTYGYFNGNDLSLKFWETDE